MKARPARAFSFQGHGADPTVPDADYAGAVEELAAKPGYAGKAREFAARYAALATIIARCKGAI